MEYFFYHKDVFWGKHNYWEVLSDCSRFPENYGGTRFICQIPSNTMTPNNG